ncbi:MAG: LysR family transcriptional regulator [Firmicutes bacterium]|nr:LysR family transcriptional regulator [Bacillota bacterium]
MEFKQLEAFVNVIKYKSFSKAAEAAYLTQPTISTHISSLEKELGVKLIDRKGKESRPTKQGRAFYNYALNIINTRERALNAMNDFGLEISGTVDIKTSSIPGQYIVPKLMASFHETYPNVSFDVEQSDSERVCGDIMDNVGEIGFTGYYENNGLKYELLVRDKMVIITPANEKYRTLRESVEKLQVTDLADEAFIWREEGSATRKTFEKLLEDSGVSINTAATVTSIEAVKACVENGMGVSVLSETAVSREKEKGGDFLIFELDGVQIDREFYMIYNKNTTLSPAAAKFRDHVIDTYLK